MLKLIWALFAALPPGNASRNVPGQQNMPDLKFVPPMLATLVRKLPEGPQWEYELKLDG
jgi:hypothetical protein